MKALIMLAVFWMGMPVSLAQVTGRTLSIESVHSQDPNNHRIQLYIVSHEQNGNTFSEMIGSKEGYEPEWLKTRSIETIDQLSKKIPHDRVLNWTFSLGEIAAVGSLFVDRNLLVKLGVMKPYTVTELPGLFSNNFEEMIKARAKIERGRAIGFAVKAGIYFALIGGAIYFSDQVTKGQNAKEVMGKVVEALEPKAIEHHNIYALSDAEVSQVKVILQAMVQK